VNQTTTLPIDQIRYVQEFQPRLKISDERVEELRLSLEQLPPIVVARGSIIVDGYHRWQAHVREGAEFIDVDDLGDLTDDQIFWEAVARNAVGPLPLSTADRKSIAVAKYETFTPKGAVAELAARLKVGETTVRLWTKNARTAQEQRRRADAWSLWLDCLTHEQIAAELDTPRQTISKWLDAQNGNLAELSNTPPGGNSDRPWGSIQHFDVWQFPTADHDGGGQQSYFGALPPQVIENLLWFWTEPGETVVDLFAGSGTTVDVAKRMGRRVWASDIRGNHYSPHLPIHQHDVTTGWPDGAPRKADLVLLDPPYWRQAAGRYSTEPGEMAEMDLEAFYAAWRTVVKSAVERTGRVAYIVSPAEVKDRDLVVDLAAGMLSVFADEGWRVERRVIVTYQTQQATGQQVEWARANKKMLKLYRDLVVLTP
jgi:hypothetical protein